MKRHNFFVAAALAGVVAAWSGSSTAAVPILEFDDAVTAQTGTLFYDGTLGSPLIGTDILFDSIRGTDTPLNNGVQIGCSGCKLNFTTGPSTQNGAVNGADWLFGPGGSFTLSGSVPAAGIVNDDIIVGSFLAADFGGSTSPVGGTGLLVSEGLDVKHEDLLDYYGLVAELFVFVNSEISVTGCQFSGATFDCDVENADIVNAPIPAPEPASLALLGLGLAGIGAARRRRSSRD